MGKEASKYDFDRGEREAGIVKKGTELSNLQTGPSRYQLVGKTRKKERMMVLSQGKGDPPETRPGKKGLIKRKRGQKRRFSNMEASNLKARGKKLEGCLTPCERRLALVVRELTTSPKGTTQVEHLKKRNTFRKNRIHPPPGSKRGIQRHRRKLEREKEKPFEDLRREKGHSPIKEDNRRTELDKNRGNPRGKARLPKQIFREKIPAEGGRIDERKVPLQ